MRNIREKLLSWLMVMAMILNYFLPVSKVMAATPSNANEYGIIQINGLTSLSDVSNGTSVSATFANGSATITGTGLYSDGSNKVYLTGDVTVSATANTGYTAEIWVNGTNTNSASTTINAPAANSVVNLDVEFNSSNTGGGSHTGNTTSNVTVSRGTGSYELRGNNVNYDDEIEFCINGSMWNHENTISYDSLATDTTVTFTFETLWINRYYDDIVINGVSYNVDDYLDFDDRTQWLVANHGTQTLSFDIPNVAKANSYNIVVKHGENNGKKYLATFLWTADPDQANSHDYIGHSKLEFVKAEYNVGNTTYTVTEKDLEGKLVRNGDHKNATSQDGFLSYGVTADVDYDDGSLTLPGGAKVTMRVVPEYGYQVTSVNGGNDFTTTDSGVSEFTITVADGTAGYFQAEVTKVDDEVLANSTKVASGTVEIKNGEIDSGTVRLSVDDVELSSDKISDFKKAAGDNYTINSYLDINLNKVLYKGTSEDVWEEQIHHLNNEALITLKLEDGVDINDIVIVHNIDNGDEFEIIEIESYDKETNTITFKTKSFSNYAIASKNSTTTSNINTGDNIINSFIINIISLSLIVILSLNLKRKILN